MNVPCDVLDPALPLAAFALVAMLSALVGLRRRPGPTSRRLALGLVLGCFAATGLFGARFPGGCISSPESAPPIEAERRALVPDPARPDRLLASGFAPRTLLRVVICDADPPEIRPGGRTNGNDVVRFASAHCDLSTDKVVTSDGRGRAVVTGVAPGRLHVGARTVDCRRTRCVIVVVQDQPGNLAYASRPLAGS